jgi:hypothetical protein
VVYLVRFCVELAGVHHVDSNVLARQKAGSKKTPLVRLLANKSGPSNQPTAFAEVVVNPRACQCPSRFEVLIDWPNLLMPHYAWFRSVQIRQKAE